MADYGNAIELAFDANLLVAAWATVYNLFNNRFKTLSDDADNLAEDTLLEEEVSIRALRNTIDVWGGWRRFLWRMGFTLCAASAAALYLLTWLNLPQSTPLAGAHVLWLWVAAFAGPGVMVGMAIVGALGSRRASGLRDDLEEQRQKKVRTREADLREVERRAESELRTGGSRRVGAYRTHPSEFGSFGD